MTQATTHSTTPKNQLTSKAKALIPVVEALFKKALKESMTFKELNIEIKAIYKELKSTYPGGRGVYTMYEQGYITALCEYRLKTLRNEHVTHAYIIDNALYTDVEYDWSDKLSDYIAERLEAGEVINDFELSLYQQGYFYKESGERFV